MAQYMLLLHQNPGTNAALPLTNWTVLGPCVESPSGSGNYQFTDPQAKTNANQFYRVRSP